MDNFKLNNAQITKLIINYIQLLVETDDSSLDDKEIQRDMEKSQEEEIEGLTEGEFNNLLNTNLYESKVPSRPPPNRSNDSERST